MMILKLQYHKANGQGALGLQGWSPFTPPPQFSPICFDVENVPSNTCLDKEHDLFTTLISSFTQFNSDEDELKVKEETGATIRCFPFEQPQGVKTCLMTGNPAEEVAIFSKSY